MSILQHFIFENLWHTVVAIIIFILVNSHFYPHNLINTHDRPYRYIKYFSFTNYLIESLNI